MNNARAQHGYTLILLLVSLLGGSMLWTQGNVHSRQHLPFLTGKADESLIQAEQARQNLLSYASSYALFYGPRGAGLGHLPCPDIDISLPVGQGGHDGPDPPCASQRRATWHDDVNASQLQHSKLPDAVAGYLPRQISLPNYRFAFGEQHTQRFHYAVSDAIINNPVNRIVNPGTLATARHPSPAVLAELIYQAPGFYRGSAIRTSPLTRESLLQVIRPAVAAWVVGRLGSTGWLMCLAQLQGWEPSAAPPARTTGAAGTDDHEAEELVTEPSTGSLTPCRDGQGWLRSCRSLRADGAAQAGLNLQADTAAQPVNVPFIELSDAQQALVVMLADAVPQTTPCNSVQLREMFVEHIPATEHWFFRNRWHHWVQLDTSSPCRAAEQKDCRLVLDDHRPAAQAASPIRLRWQNS